MTLDYQAETFFCTCGHKIAEHGPDTMGPNSGRCLDCKCNVFNADHDRNYQIAKDQAKQVTRIIKEMGLIEVCYDDMTREELALFVNSLIKKMGGESE
jgi:hypothetical protein